MVKILHGSDIHTEFGKLDRVPDLPFSTHYDIVLLSGDIGLGAAGIEWALDFFPKDKKIIFIPGNHEYYKHIYQATQLRFQQMARDSHDRLVVLDPGFIELGDWTLIGATLWSALRAKDQEYMGHYAERNIADFHVIRCDPRGLWDPAMHTKVNSQEVNYLVDKLTEFKDRKLIVATHFLPSQACTHPKYNGSPLNPYFANDLDWIMEEHKIPYWIFGHTHDVMTIDHPTGTKLISNPFGYPGENKEPNKWQILTLS